MKSTAARDGAMVMGAQGVSVLIALAVDAYLFRKLPMAEQGALSAGLALSAALLQISDLGLALTTIRIGAKHIADGRLDKAAALFRATLLARIAFATFTILITLLFRERISRDILSIPDGGALVASAAFGVFGNALVWWGVDVAQARRAFGSYAIQQITAAFAKAVGVAAVALFFIRLITNDAALSVLTVIALANLAGGMFSVFLTFGALRTPPFSIVKTPAAAHAQRIRLFEFGAYACAVAALTAMIANADMLLVKHYLSKEETAVFACARRLSMVLSLLATASITVLLPRASALDSPAACAAYIGKALKVGGVLAIVAAGGLALAASVFVPVFGGPKYTASIPILQWLCLAHGIGIFLTPLMLVFYPMRREGFVVFLNALQLGVHGALGIWLTPLYKLEGAAWAIAGGRVAVALAVAAMLIWMKRRERW